MMDVIASILGSLSLLVIALTAAAVALVGVIISQRSTDGVPGPWPQLPIVGDTITLFKEKPVSYFWRRFKQYGPVFKTSMLGYPMYIICDARYIQKVVLKDDAVEFFVPGTAFQKIITNWEHMKAGGEHLAWRRCMTTALGPAFLERVFPKLMEIVERHVAAWGKDGAVVLSQSSSALALDLGFEVLSGVKSSRADPIWLKERFLDINKGLYAPPITLPGTPLAKAIRSKRELEEALQQDMLEQLEELKQKVAKEGFEALADNKELDMMQAQLLGSMPYRQLDVRTCVERAIGNMIAATDTTRHIIFITLMLLSECSRVLSKVLEEQDKVVKEFGEQLNLKAVNAMTYLDVTVKEAMRLMPAANGGFRRAKQPLEVLGHTIPAGSVLWWNVQILHCLDPALDRGYSTSGNTALPPYMDWENQLDEAFQPERWQSEETKPKAYVTFGGGSHLCLGMNLAYAEAKLVLASVLRRYTISFKDYKTLASKLQMFPGPYPAAGTDILLLTPRSKV
mmetsp:Transcript_32847/g.72560  ORF Transcript_32847/g.72560 Transcript_32847/m.72560 type:complete len:510 (+) Transcript_32847:86-1615(+)|eukprot:CAMPEP_0202924212 /NCGR_PEP_ID=MMETSP1392-20130828/78847_1 /ASSEMBLY_ACC=CAM_ASM_000868 /TAXON_ID=225041 /ORGANISM="Chlamydomonas chlamydogama, Strain SAG 11-48b" /LENGTH=509 /DNA_ID=CAMNT_0049617931 /DNA_START=25 /DNA_END=1554 /DNA_ORIENTATION=-